MGMHNLVLPLVDYPQVEWLSVKTTKEQHVPDTKSFDLIEYHYSITMVPQLRRFGLKYSSQYSNADEILPTMPM